MDVKLLHSLQAFCAYRERSPLEVQQKALKLGISENDWPHYQRQLEEDHFLSARRFAHAYAKSKWNQNQWGRLKIAQGLRANGIAKALAEEALNSLPHTPYDAQLTTLARRKWESLQGDPQAFAKTCRYLHQKGYEPERFLPLIQQWQSQDR